MRLGFFQYAVFYRDRAANLEYIANQVSAETFDLLVLPELFTSGYCSDDPDDMRTQAEALTESSTVKALREIAGCCGGTIVGTIPEIDNGTLFNTAVVVNGSGLSGVQRKVHLTDYEKRCFSPGDAIQVIDVSGVGVGIMTCFDSWFPAFGAMLKQGGAEVFCVPSSFGGPVTPTILPIRARENQVFLINCNRIGEEVIGGVVEPFCGGSQIVSPDGEVLAEAGGEEELVFIEVDIEENRRPAFGSLLCADFPGEHARYNIDLR